MKSFILLLFISFSIAGTAQEKQQLYPFMEKGLWGFIDPNGKTAIKPRYASAHPFSEGLAAVRIKGTYGYIDADGKVVIPPRFDQAFEFSSGMALVFVDAKPYFIDKTGKIAFEHPNKEMSAYNQHGLAIVVTASGNKGLVDRKGKLVLDTLYTNIEPFDTGIALIVRHNPAIPLDLKRPYENRQSAYIDSSGQIVVPFGNYVEQEDFRNGYAFVQKTENRPHDYNNEFVINTKGDSLFTIPSRIWRKAYNTDGFYQGRLSVNIYTVDPDTMKIWYGNKRYDYAGVVDAKGNIVFSNPDWDEVTPFTQGRAFAKDVDRNWHLIDVNGNTIPTERITGILHNWTFDKNNLFMNGVAVVQVKGSWVVMDTNGRFEKIPEGEEDALDRVVRYGDVLVLEEINDKDENRYGLWNLRTKEFVRPQFERIGNFSESDLLFSTYRNGRTGYVTTSGKIVYQQKETKPSAKSRLNIDYMNRGYFYAASPRILKTEGPGGWGGSPNTFQSLDGTVSAKENKLGIYLSGKTDEKGNPTCYVANTTADSVFFGAQDSRLYMRIEAKNKKGEWQPIEYWPSSWCGNSYHQVFLAPETYWSFSYAQYDGEFKTECRIVLQYTSLTDPEKEETVYSESFKAGVNPGQFWAKPGYSPNGLMDPYND